MRAPRPVRFTREEVKFLLDTGLSSSGGGPMKSIVGKLEAAVAESAGSGPLSCTIQAAVQSMEGVLGARAVALPPRPDGAWFARMTAQIRKHRLTPEDFVKMARVLQARGWAPPFSFEKTLMAADRVLAEYEAPVSARKRNAPATMEDI